MVRDAGPLHNLIMLASHITHQQLSVLVDDERYADYQNHNNVQYLILIIISDFTAICQFGNL